MANEKQQERIQGQWARLTPDITIGCLPPTGAEYDAHIRLLREISDGPVSAWRATTLDDDECAAWVALHRCRIVETVCGGAWNNVTLTAYGRVYASQRIAARAALRKAGRE